MVQRRSEQWEQGTEEEEVQVGVKVRMWESRRGKAAVLVEWERATEWKREGAWRGGGEGRSRGGAWEESKKEEVEPDLDRGS